MLVNASAVEYRFVAQFRRHFQSLNNYLQDYSRELIIQKISIDG
jgi:hypothetical protein